MTVEKKVHILFFIPEDGGEIQFMEMAHLKMLSVISSAGRNGISSSMPEASAYLAL